MPGTSSALGVEGGQPAQAACARPEGAGPPGAAVTRSLSPTCQRSASAVSLTSHQVKNQPARWLPTRCPITVHSHRWDTTPGTEALPLCHLQGTVRRGHIQPPSELPRTQDLTGPDVLDQDTRAPSRARVTGRPPCARGHLQVRRCHRPVPLTAVTSTSSAVHTQYRHGACALPPNSTDDALFYAQPRGTPTSQAHEDKSITPVPVGDTGGFRAGFSALQTPPKVGMTAREQ